LLDVLPSFRALRKRRTIALEAAKAGSHNELQIK
jgi:hypothetical protein